MIRFNYYICLVILLCSCSSHVSRDASSETTIVTPSDAQGSKPPKKEVIIPKEPYKELSSFGKDTLAFLRYNFSLRKNYYVNKNMTVLLKDLHIPVISYVPDATNKGKFSNEGVYIDPFTTDAQRTLLSKREKIVANRFKIIYIVLANLPVINEDSKKVVANHGPWEVSSISYYQSKVVEDIQLINF